MTGAGQESDRALVERAIAKQKAGRRLTQREHWALRRFQKAHRERLLIEVVQAVPQKFYRAWAARQPKQLKELASRYGLPCDGKTVDLPALIRAFHDLLAENAHRFAPKDSAGPGFTEAESPALERKRAAEADIAEMKRDEMTGRLMATEDVRAIFTATARELRRGIRRLQRKFGPQAQQIMDNALENARRQFDSGLSTDE